MARHICQFGGNDKVEEMRRRVGIISGKNSTIPARAKALGHWRDVFIHSNGRQASITARRKTLTTSRTERLYREAASRGVWRAMIASQALTS